MTRRQTMIACAVAAVLAAPLTAGAQQKEETLRQYPQASGNTSQIAPPSAPMPATSQQSPSQSKSQQSKSQQSQQSQQSKSPQSQQSPDLVVITVAPAMSARQRAEATFRTLDTNGDGEISMAEAGVNTQLLTAFQKLDRNSNRTIDRNEFASVRVDDGGSQASSSAASGGTRAPAASEPSGRLPSRSIEERSRFSLPSESQEKPSR